MYYIKKKKKDQIEAKKNKFLILDHLVHIPLDVKTLKGG